MKKLKYTIAALLGTLTASFDSPKVSGVLASRRYALANELGLMNDHGIETLQIDPAATLPIGTRYLIYERGSAYNYGRIAGGANVPLGVSGDSPYAVGDLFEVRRLGAKKGFELGVPASAITQDHLVAVDPAGTGKVVDLTTQGNGTYWVIGRCLKTVAATDIEVAYVPDIPYQVNNNNGTWTYTGANA